MRFHIHHYHHYDNDVTLIKQMLGEIMSIVDQLQAKADATLAQVQADTNVNTAIAKVVDDMNQTITTLKQQLQDAGTDPAKLQKLSDTMDAVLQTDMSNSKIVADKVTANTPAADTGSSGSSSSSSGASQDNSGSSGTNPNPAA